MPWGVVGNLVTTAGTISFVDMNGDGLPDLTWTGITLTSPWGSTTNVIYRPNLGGKGFGAPVIMSNKSGANMNTQAWETGNMVLVDMNGDGLPDFLVGRANSYVYYPNRDGKYFDDPVLLQGSPAVDLGRTYASTPVPTFTALADMNGDGIVDIVQGNAKSYSVYSLNMSDNHRFMDTATNPLGGVSSFAYERQRFGVASNWAASSLTRDDGLANIAKTQYQYYNGKYAPWPDNEFRGYATSNWSEALFGGGWGQTKFNQGNDWKGLPSQTSTGSSITPVWSITDYRYGLEYLNGITRADLVSQVTKVTDTAAPGVTNTIRTDYSNYDVYGNPHTVTTSGTGIPTRVATTDYVPNTSGYIVNRPSRTDTRDGSTTGTIISQQWFSYDGQAKGVAPTKGNVTSQENWLSGGTNPITQYSYNSTGSRIGTIDPKGNICALTGSTSAVGYDTTYYTYPMVVTNALCQQTISTYWGVAAPTLPTLNAADAGGYPYPGTLASVTDPNGVRTDNYWDSLGRPLAVVVPPQTAADPTVEYMYNFNGTVPSRVWEYRYVYSPGVSADGWVANRVGTVLDGFGRPIQRLTDSADQNVTIAQDTWYNARGLVESISMPYNSTWTIGSAFARDATKAKVTTTYDVYHRPLKVTNTDGTYSTNTYKFWDVTHTDENRNAITRSYDAMGRLTKVVEPSGGLTTTYAYDTFDTAGTNTQKIDDGQGAITLSYYNTLGQRTSLNDPDLGVLSYTYDANGNLLTQKDAKLQTTTFGYDALNRVQTKTYPDLTKVTNTYDNPALGAYGRGRLQKVADPSGFTIFTYDMRGRIVQMDKLIGTGATTSLATNPGFELGTAPWPSTWVKDPHGGTATFTWDAAIKRSGTKSVSIANPTADASISHPAIAYDATKTFSASAWVKTQSLSTPAARIEVNFYSSTWAWLGYRSSDAMGSTAGWTWIAASVAAGSAPAGAAYIDVALAMDTATGTAWFDDVSFGSTVGLYSMQAAYDNLNRVTFTTYPDGEKVENSYTYHGLLRKVTSLDYGNDYISSMSYSPLGKVISRTAGNGTATTYDYYDTATKGPLSFRLRNMTTPGGLQNATYSYDNVGNISHIVDGTWVPSQDFSYDALNRLVTAAARDYTFGYGYAPNGNMTIAQGKTFSYPLINAARPHAPLSDGSCTYGYDNNGNLINRNCGGAVRTFTWDSDNRLTQIKDGTAVVGTYNYDYAGNRVKKVEGTATTVIPFPSYRIVNGAPIKYYYANGERIAERDSTKAVFYYHPDHLGSSNYVTDGYGTAVKSTQFTPYGSSRYDNLSKPIAYKFNGQELDTTTGLYNYGARYYDPNLMRFISADNVIPNPANPQMLNRYSYVLNNPLRFKDPTGNVPVPFEMPISDPGNSSYWVENGLKSTPSFIGQQQLSDIGQIYVLSIGAAAGGVALAEVGGAAWAGASAGLTG